MIRVGFFWTPSFASDILRDLLLSSDFEVVFAVTNPDALVGRNQELRQSPVKELALNNNIPVFTPEKITGNDEFLAQILAFEADYFVVAAYGKILPMSVLDAPKKLCVNVHGSILPKYRWASPIQACLLAWDAVTGVTIMAMSKGMDEGDILDILPIPIDKNETSETLFAKFSWVSGAFLLSTLRSYDAGNIVRIPQEHEKATYCKKIAREDGRLDFTKTAKELYHRYQAYTPWPGIHTIFDNKRLLVEDVYYIVEDDLVETWLSSLPVWTIFRHLTNEPGIRTSHGALIFRRLKLEWKKSLSSVDFLRGYPALEGAVLS